MPPDDGLTGLDPDVAAWFRRQHGAPTDVQKRTWPVIARGANVLATAPTGSGKTLCAFMVPIERLLTGAWDGGTVRVLYVSPLKALNNDIERNLLSPLETLSQAFSSAGRSAAPVRVAVRSGDSSSEDRRRMARHPPEILVTTPESLNILLTSTSGRGMLGGVRMVILDEIHAVAGSRRGLWLMHGVEALTELAGEVQRVALSATVRPLERIAAMLGGHRRSPDGTPEARTRPVEIVQSDIRKKLAIEVRALLPDQLPGDGGLDALTPIARAIGAATERNRSTLVFTNSRALCEKLAMRVNDSAEASSTPLAFAHHGSLSREIRHEVEGRLKQGDLRAIVATSSLELGIDIGALDEVVMVQAPPSIAAAVQRAGRAGHGVGEISRAVLHPTHPRDALECAVLARSALRGDIEETHTPGPALDVLAQMIVVRLAIKPRSADALYDAIRTITPYRSLARELFDPVLAMLLGRYAGERLPELSPRLLEDPDTGRIELRRGALLALYASGGMIPDRGYYQLRHADSNARLGELDEEFVWENGPGRTFALGSQQWRVQRVTHNDVYVTPAPNAAFAPPFWRAEDRDRDAHLSERIGEFLRDADKALANRGTAGLEELLGDAPVDGATVEIVRDHLLSQRAHTGCALPHVDHLLIERVRSGPGGYGGSDGGGQLVLHNLAGGAVNRPWGLALAARWRERFGELPEIYTANDVIVVQGGGHVSDETLMDLLSPTGLIDLLRHELEGSGLFGARFRESAGRSLLIQRGRFGERIPLWMRRLASQRLLGRVQGFEDFPVLLEAWRSCLDEHFDLPRLTATINRIAERDLAWSDVVTQTPSPFAAESGWRQINEYMYADDRPRTGQRSATATTLIETAVREAQLRPTIERAVTEAFVQRRRRLQAGWHPRSPLELRDWLRERGLLRQEEFEQLTSALGDALDGLRAFWVSTPDDWVVDTRDAKAFGALVDGSASDDDRRRWLMRWLRFEPPRDAEDLAAAWPGPQALLLPDLQRLVGDGSLVVGTLIDGDTGAFYCDADNHEAMLRMQRAARRPNLAALPQRRVAEYLLSWQRVGEADDLVDAVEPLRLLPVPAELWEDALLPARTRRSCEAEFDALLGTGAMILTGAGGPHHKRRELLLLAADEVDLAPSQGAIERQLDARLRRAFPDPAARYGFDALLETEGDPAAAAELLWAGIFEGHVAIESFATVRHGLATGFRLPSATPAMSPQTRSGLRARIRARVHGIPGRFQRIAHKKEPRDEVERLDLARRRARVVLDRWGIACPDLLAREMRGLRWGDLFRALRLMELAGEVTSGHFLDGLQGPQFATPDAVALVRDLGAQPMSKTARWLDGRDPASPASLGLDLQGLPAPARRAGAALVLDGDRVALVTERGGKRLTIDATVGEGAVARTLAALAAALSARKATLEVREIDAGPARSSRHIAALEAAFTIQRDHKSLTLAARET